LLRRFLLTTLLLGLAACEDPFAFEKLPLVSDSTTLYSISRSELIGYPSAFDFVDGRRRIVVEGSAEVGLWDILLAEENGQFVLVPQGAVLDPRSRAGIGVEPARAFDDVHNAPADTAFYRRHVATPVRTDEVYLVRTRLQFGCVRYAKLQPIALDDVIGTMRFRYVYNPNCGDRELRLPQD
jgi:hypothetical protein